MLLLALKSLQKKAAGAACSLDAQVTHLSHQKLLRLSHLFASGWRYQALPSCWVRARCWQHSSWHSSSQNTRRRVPRRARSWRGVAVWQERTPTRHSQAATRTSSLFWRTALCDWVWQSEPCPSPSQSLPGDWLCYVSFVLYYILILKRFTDFFFVVKILNFEPKFSMGPFFFFSTLFCHSKRARTCCSRNGARRDVWKTLRFVFLDATSSQV